MYLALQLTVTAADTSAILGAGATRQRVNLLTTASRPIALPSLVEQLAIADHVRSETSPIRLAVAAVHTELHLIAQYRTHLISDVVTGKLDIREAAALLPVEGDETAPEVSDEFDNIQADEEDDLAMTEAEVE